MGLGLEGISSSVGEFAADLFEGAGPYAATETGKFLRDGIPPIPGYIIPIVGVEVGRRACKRYADNADVFDSGSAAQFENLCRPYLDDIGYGSPPSIRRPFTGGQCEVDYYLIYAWKPVNTDGSLGAEVQQPSVTIPGPIRGLEGRGAAGARQIVVTYGAGQEAILRQSSAQQGDFQEVRIVQAVRLDGQPDSCGNPPPEVTNPGPDPSPLPPGPTPFNPGPGIDIDIDVDIDIDPVLGPRIVFDIGDGPVTIDPFPDGDGEDGGDDDGGSPVSGLPPGDIGSPGTPEPTGEDGKASGCAPANSVLVGVKVNILTAPPFASEYDPLVRRGACYVYMGTSSNLALEPAGVALRSGQMFFAPLDNLTCWEVNANSGYVLQVIPYYRALEAQEV